MITSVQNAKVKWVRSLQASSRARREAGVFLIEGVRLAEEALAAGWTAQLVLYSDELRPRGRAVVEGLVSQGAPIELVSPQVLAAASDTQAPQGVLAVIPQKNLPLPAAPNFILVPDEIRDPGNLGSMLRSAAASGVQGVLIPEASVDAFAPKVIRSAMGAHFRLPIHTLPWEDIRGYLKRAGLQVYLADAAGELPYWRADLQPALALVLGGEAAGAGETARSLADVRLQIPMPGGVESLNAAAAAAILLFEVVRQRRSLAG